MADFDLQIKGGTVVDGTRVPRYRADVWIKDGKIAQVGGRAPGFAKKVIDADGLIVAPGFVDLHTHYDAQIRWDPYCTISGWHGVTSVVLGNCGFGFVPVKPDFRERSMLTMTRTEAIPYESMKVGMKWDWETIPQYLDSLDRAAQGRQRDPVPADLVADDLRDGPRSREDARPRPRTNAPRCAACSPKAWTPASAAFRSSGSARTPTQADFDGSPMVTDTMCDEDILNLARVLRERDEGFIQITQATGHIKDDLAFVERLAAEANRPILHNAIAPARNDPKSHQRSLAWLKRCREKGLPIFGQTATLRTGFAFTLEHWNLYDASPAWRAVTTGTQRRKDREDEGPRAARGASSASTTRRTRSSRSSRRASADRSVT